ncbi:MAG: hypothetical protein IKK33_06890 [Lachnospiraceae bacterium]|nr:hypothetical protein [Lachnospiraceae bacterium]
MGTNDKKIGSKTLAILHNDIQLYNKMKGNDYLIAFKKGKKDTLKYCQLTFQHYNFWHLLGCKIDNGDAELIYNECMHKKDISENVVFVHNFSNVEEKHCVFEKVFDFISKAREITIGYIGDCPEKYMIAMSLGNESGFVGYDYDRDNNKFMFPKTVQKKKISIVLADMNKIQFILSKPQEQKEYDTLEYEIKKDITKELLTEIPDEYCVKI